MKKVILTVVLGFFIIFIAFGCSRETSEKHLLLFNDGLVA